MSTEPEGTPMNPPDACPDDERLREYAEGRPLPEGFASGFLVQPTCTFGMFYVDHGMTAKLVPNGVGEVTLVSDWFVHEDAVEGVDYDLDRLVELWDITHAQDIELANRQQLGIGSRKYEPGPDSKRYEPGIESALNIYLEMVGEVDQFVQGGWTR